MTDNNTLIIDNGSSSLRSGFVGQSQPSQVVPTVIGHPREQKYSVDWFIGDEALNNSSTLRMKYPIERGVITNWDLMEKLWEYLFSRTPDVTPEECPVLLTEPACNPKANREKTTQIMFETFCVPTMYLVVQAALSLYASGQLTGIVFDSGYSETQTVPIYQGHSLPYAVGHVSIAGLDLTFFMRKLMQDRGYFTSTTTPPFNDLKVSNDIKELLCYVSLDFEEEIKTSEKNFDSCVTYKLPDGTDIVLGDERFRCTEALFNPSFLGYERPGAIETLYHSITWCNIDIRDQMYSNVLLAGGNTMFPGMTTRVQKELSEMAPQTKDIKIKTLPDNIRNYSAWLGGSIFASLSNFQNMCISKNDYDEYGPVIVHKKCF